MDTSESGNARQATEGQAALAAFMERPSFWPGDVKRVECVETHISRIFLAGSRAWKMKKAVRLPYLDFSTLEKRRLMCARELEINRAFSPRLYLGLDRVARAGDGFALNGPGETVEWLVRMRRFDRDDIFSAIAARGPLGRPILRALAQTVARSHVRAAAHRRRGGAEIIRRVAEELRRELRARAGAPEREMADRLLERIAALTEKHGALLDARGREGWVRRCHGDLHLGNIVLMDGAPVLFDALEFSEELATVDILYDLSFLLMDLFHRGQGEGAGGLLNFWLRFMDDDAHYAAAGLIGLFTACRAGIRAMVLLERAGQQEGAGRRRDIREAGAYLRTALACSAPRRARVIAIGGFSGGGKTTLARAIAPRLGPCAAHLRSDVERKILAGVDEFTRLGPEHYTPEAAKKVYERLFRRARLVAASGWPVIVDAVFSTPEERRGVEQAARAAGAEFRGLWLEAAPAVLRRRVAGRTGDASDATPGVVDLQVGRGTGEISWARVDASGPASRTAAAALEIIGAQERGA